MSIQERTNKGRTTFRARVYRKGKVAITHTFRFKREALAWEAYQKELIDLIDGQPVNNGDQIYENFGVLKKYMSVVEQGSNRTVSVSEYYDNWPGSYRLFDETGFEMYIEKGELHRVDGPALKGTLLHQVKGIGDRIYAQRVHDLAHGLGYRNEMNECAYTYDEWEQICDWHHIVDGSIIPELFCSDDAYIIELWCDHNTIHREDGPAITWSDGSETWVRNGVPHREDGPAVINKSNDGENIWALFGNLVDEKTVMIEKHQFAWAFQN